MQFDERSQPLIQLIDLPRQLLDALGRQPQGDASGLGGILVVPAVFAVERAEAPTGPEQLAVAQAGQRLPQSRVGYDQDGLELVDRLGAGLDRRVASQWSQPPTPVAMRPPAISSGCWPRCLPPPQQESTSGRTCGGASSIAYVLPVNIKDPVLRSPAGEGTALARQILSAVDEMTPPQRVAAGEVIGQALVESDRRPDLKAQVIGELWLRDLELTAWRVLHADRRSDDPAGRKAFLDAWTSV
jgi:hypothetical protein